MHPNKKLVLLPGLLCDDAVWLPMLDALNITKNYYIPDYGDLDSLASMAEYVLNQIEDEQVILFGHSMGGRIAMEIMHQAPERVSHLGLFDTAYRSAASGEKGTQEKEKRMALLAIAKQKGMRVMGEQWALGMVHPQFHDSPVFDAILDMLARKTPDIFAAQIQALLTRPDMASTLRKIHCPTLFVCGEHDLWSPVSVHQEMQTLIDQSTLSVIPHCAHMSTMEQPQQIAHAVQQWLNKH